MGPRPKVGRYGKGNEMNATYEESETLAAIRHANAYELANIADCGIPASSDSAGAEMLDTVRLATLDALRYGNLTDDTISEIADSCPSVYTGEIWAQFTDLAAWAEDIEEFAPDEYDMTKRASVALYMISERLVRRIADMIGDEFDGVSE